MEFGPCLEQARLKADPHPIDCSRFEQELSDILAYEGVLNGTWADPDASSLLVALHDLITASIDKEWTPPLRRQKLCVQHVLEQLESGGESHMNISKDLPIVRQTHGTVGLWAAVPGVGQECA